jgi:chromosome segregation ATPase
MDITFGDVVALLGGLAGILMAVVALWKVHSESFVTTGREWRELLSEAKNQLDRLEKEMGELEREVKELKTLIRDKDNQVMELTKENGQLKERIEVLETQNEGLVDSVGKLEERNVELTMTIERVEQEKKVLEEALVALKAEVEAAQNMKPDDRSLLPITA